MKIPGLFTARKRSKYGAVKTTGPDGTVFASKAEAKRDGELQVLQRAGKISLLERQVSYVLAPSVHLHGEKRLKPALRYVADFRYFDGSKGHFIVEDTKGRDNPVSRLKRHLMKSIHGIDVVLS